MSNTYETSVNLSALSSDPDFESVDVKLTIHTSIYDDDLDWEIEGVEFVHPADGNRITIWNDKDPVFIAVRQALTKANRDNIREMCAENLTWKTDETGSYATGWV